MTKIQTPLGPQPGGLFHHVLWTITPRPVWIIGTCNADGTANLSTITCVTNNPGPPENIILSSAAARTNANITRTGEFSVNLCNGALAGLADYVGSVSGEAGPKNGMPYTLEWGTAAKVPVLDLSPCVLECKLSHTHTIGMFHTFFGEVMNMHLDEKLNPPKESREVIMQWFNELDIPALDMLVYQSIKKYYKVGEKR